MNAYLFSPKSIACLTHHLHIPLVSLLHDYFPTQLQNPSIFAFRSLHYGMLHVTAIKWIYLLHVYELYLNKVPRHNDVNPP